MYLEGYEKKAAELNAYKYNLSRYKISKNYYYYLSCHFGFFFSNFVDGNNLLFEYVLFNYTSILKNPLLVVETEQTLLFNREN